MKLNKLIIGALIAFGVVVTGGQTVHAALTIESDDGVYYSDRNTVALYGDPELTQPLHKNLDPKINAWKTFKMALDANGKKVAVDLGGSQWVKVVQYTPERLEVIRNYSAENGMYKEYFSGGRALMVYSDPYLTKAIGTLDPKISHWRITGVSNVDQSDYYGFSFDLGDNQWVGKLTSTTEPIYNAFYFMTGTPLYDQNGSPTTILKNDQHYTYKVLEAKLLNNQIAVRIGDNNQWAYYNSGTPY
ncbi:hypothetical protein FHQ08_04140 [Lactobacillus sp. CC-MHH1034]|uniref:hypothetical protein n=1 Tax=Agrilactobacillus fermenti TaxID=2586909 RepID=UPI001E43F0A9|nr:hypothetical protein [Agrilactobacillus fermenti]MCD2255906.1 hypothetical protein [Agrilactobacillus fermenti]